MSELIAERSGGVLTLTLNRPAKRNALSEGLIEDLLAEFTAANSARTDLVVLRGEGRSFSAGFDLGDLTEQSDGDLMRRFVRVEELLQTVYHAPYQTLALAHGRVFGAAADLLCACAYRVATPDATFRLPGLAFGIVLGTRRLSARVGADHARLVQGHGVTLDAERAHRIGLLTEVAGQDRWAEIQDDLSASAARIPPAGLPGFQRALRTDTRDADLADLARSASVPGLRERIQRFRTEQMS